MLRLLTLDELKWQAAQRVTGKPSLSRLCAALQQAGFAPVHITLEPDREAVAFQLGRSGRLRWMDRRRTLRRLISVFRASGFDVVVALRSPNAKPDRFVIARGSSELQLARDGRRWEARIF